MRDLVHFIRWYAECASCRGMGFNAKGDCVECSGSGFICAQTGGSREHEAPMFDQTNAAPAEVYERVEADMNKPSTGRPIDPRLASYCGAVGVRHTWAGQYCARCGADARARRDATPHEAARALERMRVEEEDR